MVDVAKTTKKKSSGLKPASRVRGSIRNRESVQTGISFKINEIKEGYPLEKFDLLKDNLGVNKEALARVANISLATMHRRKNASGRLSSDDSEKIYRFENLFSTALEVLESRESVQAWFNTAQIVFEGRTPLEYADTLPGAEEVERVLRRMEHGIVL